MFRSTALALATAGALVSLAACGTMSRRTTVESGGDVAVTSTTPVNNRAIPAGATLHASLDQALGTGTSKVGDTFSATVTSALMAQDGSRVVPAGAKIEGRVTLLDDSDNAAEPARIGLAFDRIRFDGRSYTFTGEVIQSNPVETGGQSSADRTRQVVIGGAVGAALGGLLGGKDKVLIGGAVGAAAGSLISLGTEVNASLPAGSSMTVRATQTTVLR